MALRKHKNENDISVETTKPQSKVTFGGEVKDSEVKENEAKPALRKAIS
jgi:hypothetical protein